MDTFTREQRSENMRRIRAVDTRPELVVRALLRRVGIAYRLYAKNLPGQPDIVLARRRTVIFVNGCFWHGHRCTGGRRPKSNTNYWNAKLERNLRRDRRIARTLRAVGWKRMVIWECQLKSPRCVEARLKRALTA